MKNNKKIIPVMEDNELLLLGLRETNPSKEFIEELRDKYNETLKINYRCKDRFNTEDIDYLKRKYLASNVEVIKELTRKEFKYTGSRTIKKGNNDGLWYMESHHYETEAYPASTTIVDYEVEISKSSYLAIFLNMFISYSQFYDNNINLKKIITLIKSLENKAKKFTSKEHQLKEKELLELLREYLSLVEITDTREYYSVNNIYLSLLDQPNIEHHLTIRGKQTTDKTKRQNYNITYPDETSKLLEFLVNNGYIQNYKRTDNGIMLLEYTNTQLNIAKENTILLNNELEPLKKSLIKK